MHIANHVIVLLQTVCYRALSMSDEVLCRLAPGGIVDALDNRVWLEKVRHEPVAVGQIVVVGSPDSFFFVSRHTRLDVPYHQPSPRLILRHLEHQSRIELPRRSFPLPNIAVAIQSFKHDHSMRRQNHDVVFQRILLRVVKARRSVDA